MPSTVLAPESKLSSPSEASISEDEAALYDRQIRLWGLEAQSKLKRARILLLGMTPLGAEIAKNLVLAGIASLDIFDEHITTRDDPTLNFLIPESAVGENRAKASVPRTQALNPMVRVCAHDCGLSDNLLDELRTHDVVILTCETLRESFSLWLTVDHALKDWGPEVDRPQVICALSVAAFGVAFVNLHHHEFMAEHVVPKKRIPTTTNGPKVQQLSNTETVFSKKAIDYPLLHQSLQLRWNVDDQPFCPKHIPKGFLVTKILQQCARTDEPLVMESLQARWKTVSQELSVPENLLTDEDLECCFGPHVPAVNAILGGVVSQEIVRAITAKGAPQGNWYFLDGSQCSVTVEWLPVLTELA